MFVDKFLINFDYHKLVSFPFDSPIVVLVFFDIRSFMIHSRVVKSCHNVIYMWLEETYLKRFPYHILLPFVNRNYDLILSLLDNKNFKFCY